MIQTNCSKCGADLILHEGYGVCNSCGNIVPFDIEEEIEEIAEEIPEIIEEPTEEVAPEETVYYDFSEDEFFDEPADDVIEELPTEEPVDAENTPVEEIEIAEEPTEAVEEIEAEEVSDEAEEVEEAKEEVAPEETEEAILSEEEHEEEIIEEAAEENIEKVEEPEVSKMLEFEDAPKRKKAPIIIAVAVIVCALIAVAGFLFKDALFPVETIEEPREEPEIAEEIEEVAEDVGIEETEEEVAEEIETPAPVEDKKPKKTVTPAKTDVPPISYRIRKSADDSTTQIGAFSDLERAKAFAQKHAEDGYKVFDLNGTVVFEP